MPRIPITGDGKPFFELTTIKAVMYYPNDNDSEKRDEFLKTHNVKLALAMWDEKKFLERLPVSKDLIAELLHCRPYHEITEQTRARGISLVIAGHVLMTLYSLYSAGKIEEPSIGKSIHILLREYEQWDDFPKSERAVRTHWKNYQSVSHLSAAWNLCQPSGLDFGEITFLLGIAEEFRKFGENTIAPRINQPILDANETWKVPDNLPLPETNLDELLTPIEIKGLLDTYHLKFKDFLIE